MTMKLALIGLKGHVETILKGAAALEDVTVVAVADDSPRRVDAYLQRPQLKAADRYDNWRHLVEHALFDVCCVADENGVRAEQLIALFGRNVHVVTEKPLTTTAADFTRVREAFAKSKSQLTMLLELRHQPKNVRVRELIQSGAIGAICQVATQKSYKWGERPGWFHSRERLGGTIPYIGIHSLDIIRYVTGLNFTHVAAVHGKQGWPATNETENHAAILARLENGASVTARLDYLRPATASTHGDDRLRVVGTHGVIEVNDGDDAVTVLTSGKSERIPYGETENLFVEFGRFLRGGAAPRITADDSFYISDVVLRARAAADALALAVIPPWKPLRS